jgi:S1-C subfamily serine protease
MGSNTRRRRAVHGWWLVAAIASSFAAAGCAPADPGALQDFPNTTRQQLIQERDEPAIVLLEMSYTATFVVPTADGTTPATRALVASLEARRDAGLLPNDRTYLNDLLVQEYYANPDQYFTLVPPFQQVQATVTFRCTGAIVTPDGYVVTAAHCTAPPKDSRLQGYLASGVQATIDAGSHATPDGWTTDQLKYLFLAYQKFIGAHTQMTAESAALTGLLFSASSTGHVQEKRVPLTVVTQGSAPASSTGPFGDRDVSIVKLGGQNDLPTLPVGSDADVEAGQQIYVDGFPGAAENGNLENLSTPSITAGPISAKKTSDQGLPLLETPAAISGGNSGGPGLDDANRMVGVVSYGSSVVGTSYNYLIGASIVQDDLRAAGIRPRESATTDAFDRGLNDLHRRYFRRALSEFETVQRLDPDHPTVSGYITRSEDAIERGQDQTPPVDVSPQLLAVLAALAAGIVLVATIATAARIVVSLVRRSPARR